MDPQRFRKKVNPNQQIHLKDSRLSDGLICDLHIKFNALRLPLNERISCSKDIIKNEGQTTPKIYTDLKKYLGNFVSGLTKRELGDYIIQLLLNCPPDSLSESIHSSPQDERTMNSLPEDSLHSLSRSNDLSCKHIRQASRASNRQSELTNKIEQTCAKEVSQSSKYISQEHSRGTHEHSYYHKIVSTIDLLCDMRSLLNRTMNGSVDAIMDELQHLENKLPQSSEKSSKRRRSGGGCCKESDVMKCNRRVQTEVSLIHLKPGEDVNFQHGLGHNSREYDDISKCPEYGANSHDRFKDHYCHLQTPYPLTPPRLNLSYKKYT